jgi:dihydroflavonol-4-reductase
MKILLTGATGFIGSHVARRLLAAGHTVRALSRASSSRAALGDAADAVDWAIGDVVEPASLAPAVAGCEAVIHAAAMVTFDPRLAERQRAVNVDGTRYLLEAARAAGVRRFVLTSSVSTIGRVPKGQLADEQTRYDWPVGLGYNESKRDAEDLVREAQGIETVTLNPAVVFGPGDVYRRLLPLYRLCKWRLFVATPTGGTTVCDVRDVADAHVAALTAGSHGERYILGGAHLRWRELISLIAGTVGGWPPRWTIPDALVRATSSSLAALQALVPLPVSPPNMVYLTHRAYYASDKAARDLGYRMRLASQSVADTAAWYREENLL